MEPTFSSGASPTSYGDNWFTDWCQSDASMTIYSFTNLLPDMGKGLEPTKYAAWIDNMNVICCFLGGPVVRKEHEDMQWMSRRKFSMPSITPCFQNTADFLLHPNKIPSICNCVFSLGVPCTSSEFHLLNDPVVLWFLFWAEGSILRKEHLFISCHVGGRSVPLPYWVVSNETRGMVLFFRLLECAGFVVRWHSNGLACYHFILQCEPSWSEENSMVSNSCNACMWCDLDYAFDHPLNHISWT